MTWFAGAMVRRGRRGLAVTLALAAAVLVTGVVAAMSAVAGPAAKLNLLATATGAAAEPRSPAPGFVFERGRFIPVVVPRGLAGDAPQGIAPIDINDRGQIVGTYGILGGSTGGVLLDRGLRDGFGRIDVPDAKGTQPQGINNRGQIVGKYSTVSSAVSSEGVPVRGFLFDGRRYVRLDFPGARSSQAFDINDRGQVVGEYEEADGDYHGYLWERGRFRTIDGPGAGGTSATGINNRGQIIGTTGPGPAAAGFMLAGGRFSTVTIPGASLTVPYKINDHGQIAGVSASARTSTTGSGFRRDAGGRVAAIKRPGKDITSAFGINNRGQIVGVAVNSEDLATAYFHHGPDTDESVGSIRIAT